MTPDLTPLRPGDAIGILGGGQLGRMLAVAAAQLGLDAHVLCPDPDSPAFAVSAHAVCAPYEDESALERFAGGVKAITYEFENVPARTVASLASRVPVFPPPSALAVTQDRLAEKTLARSLGLETAAFAPVGDLAGLLRALQEVGTPAILKTRRLGYDGKGQVRLEDGDDPEAGFDAIGRQSAILEGRVPFEKEISVVAVRGRNGAFAAYEPIWNEHEDGILRRSRVPAGIDAATAQAALEVARRLGEALDFVGVFCVEMFLEGDRLLVNEIAPRVHNSGHWTLDACPVDQFENHVRAVAGWPLGSTMRLADAAMQNLIGEEVAAWPALLAEPEANLHLYGKREAREGRKMGHVTRLGRPPQAG